MAYLAGIPTVIAYVGYSLYFKSRQMEDERKDQLLRMEEKYLTDNEKVVKLENFKKKIFAVGVEDQLSGSKVLSEDEQNVMAESTMFIRNLIKEVKPEVVVLEMCNERYEHWFFDAISHPNYDHTLMDVHRILDTGKALDLKGYKGLDLSKSSSHVEFLVGLDQCSYRNMPAPCQTVFGDRSIKITNKRYKSKLKMLEVYKETLNQQEKAAGGDKESKKNPSIFDLDSTQSDQNESVQKDVTEQILKLRSAMRDIQNQVVEQIMPEKKEEPRVQKAAKEGDNLTPMEDIAARARVEAVKSADQIYEEVVIDEINEELLKSAQKCDGDVVVMLIRQERLKSFEKLWRQANLDYYQTQDNRRKQIAVPEGKRIMEQIMEEKRHVAKKVV
ncbi:hypothetical protein FGO68_gene11472 [Halteria grandinella]|uniref:Uncharacterized protein n=1 Tax=Halteria grandinella TaxID=5974 RepID=A0A8J8T4A2_HALGN|nr:hypothetical protein FGO68_gene11472 [Halteria grandinella]